MARKLGFWQQIGHLECQKRTEKREEAIRGHGLLDCGPKWAPNWPEIGQKIVFFGPLLYPLVNPVQDSLGRIGGGQKTQIFSWVFGQFGAQLGLQSSKPWPRMASSRFSVHFWHCRCPFCCQKPDFQSIFPDFLRCVSRIFSAKSIWIAG